MDSSNVPKLEALSPLVFRVLGCNPSSMTLSGTNTYLVGSGKKKILIDTGEPFVSEYVKNLKHALKNRLNDAEIEKVVCTHWHPDHVGGTESLYRSLPGGKNIEFYKHPRIPNGREMFSPSCGFKYIIDGHVFRTEGATLRVLYTPGHSDDHICLLLEEEHSIFSGDCILGKGYSVFEDLPAYMKTLNTILELKPNRIYPGHGPVITNAIPKIEMYINNRKLCDKRILECLKNIGKPLSSDEIVEAVYEDGISPSLYAAAEGNIIHHLQYLEQQKKIVKCGHNKWNVRV